MPERTAAVPALRVRNLSKAFGNAVVLNGMSLDVDAGEVHALAGSNGSGKSTFIKILSGYHRPENGSEIVVGTTKLDVGSPEASYSSGLRFVHQDLGLIDALSIEDNLCLNRGYATSLGTIRGRANRRDVKAALEPVGLDINPRTLVERLTPANRTAVAVARALWSDDHVRARVLVLDEPTATLPANDVERLLELLSQVAAAGVGVIYVTHRLGEIYQIAHNVTVLRDGRQVFTGPVSSTSRNQLLHLMVGGELDEAAMMTDAAQPIGSTLLQVEGLVSDRLAGIDLTARAGEVVGIAGITGSGSETLLGAAFGAIGRTGRVKIGDRVVPPLRPEASIRAGAAYVPADRKASGGILEASARENFSMADVSRLWRGWRLDRRQERQETASWFANLDVRPAGKIELPFKAFSGGNQQKIVLAKWLRARPRVILLDEPTQGVDVAAKAVIHREVRAAAARGAAVVVSSSDVDELVALCDRVVILRDGRVATTLPRSGLTASRLSRECVGSLDPESDSHRDDLDGGAAKTDPVSSPTQGLSR